MVNIIINKQITIIITCLKPVVSPKLIYDELRLKFLGMCSQEEEKVLCYLPLGTRVNTCLSLTPALGLGPGHPQKETIHFSHLLSCLARLSFLGTLLAFLIQLFFWKFIQRIYAYEIII